jgi:hypothetical protein
LSDAVIYQWDDEFGDVGAPNPELEQMLFEDANLQRAGEAIKALAYEVEVQGPEKIHPIRDVSMYSGTWFGYSLLHSSAKLVSIRSCLRTLSCASTRVLHLFSPTAFPQF